MDKTRAKQLGFFIHGERPAPIARVAEGRGIGRRRTSIRGTSLTEGGAGCTSADELALVKVRARLCSRVHQLFFSSLASLAFTRIKEPSIGPPAPFVVLTWLAFVTQGRARLDRHPWFLVSAVEKKRRFGADILLFRNHKKDLDTVTQWGNIAFFPILPWEIDHRPKPMLHEIFRCSFFHNFGVTQTICLCRYFVKRPGGREYGGGEG